MSATEQDGLTPERRRLAMLIGAALAAADDCHRAAVKARDWELGQATATAQLAMHDALRLARRGTRAPQEPAAKTA